MLSYYKLKYRGDLRLYAVITTTRVPMSDVHCDKNYSLVCISGVKYVLKQIHCPGSLV